MILNKFFGKFQLKIKNRESAGNILAGALKDIIKKVNGSNIIVVGLPRGGFVMAEIIARKLSCNLDMIISKRLRSPHNEEIAIGAVAEDSTTYLNKTLIEELKMSDERLDKELSYQLQEIRRLSAMYYQGKKTLLETNYITDNNKTIIIVDDGAATGSTIIAASRSLRKKYNPTFIIVAITVSPKGTIDILKKEGIDHIEVITSPNDSNFGTVEQFYQNFDQVSDNEILNIIHTRKKVDFSFHTKNKVLKFFKLFFMYFSS